MSEWKEVTIGNLCKISRGGSPRPIQDFIQDSGTPWVKIADARANERFIYKTKEFIKPVGEAKSRVVFPGDFILSNSATPGLPRFMKIRACIHDGWLLLRDFVDEIDQMFFHYLLVKEREALLIQGNGSIFTNLKTDILREHTVLLPPLNEQKSIASILSSLDDKIDLLHRQNATLEKMAETLFRQWFVEEAKEEWEEVKIKDFDVIVTDFVANGSFASLKENVKLINDGTGYALFIRNTDLKSDFATKVYVDEHAYNFLSKTKLFGGEVIISSVGDVGSVFRCPNFKFPMTLGNNVVMLKSKFNNFFYLFFNSDFGQSLIYGITSGSVQEKFNKTAFRDITISYPSLDYIDEFESFIDPYFGKIDKNKEQIRTLTALRDTLLPKLMSGEAIVTKE